MPLSGSGLLSARQVMSASIDMSLAAITAPLRHSPQRADDKGLIRIFEVGELRARHEKRIDFFIYIKSID